MDRRCSRIFLAPKKVTPMTVITWDSEPDYDGWGWDTKWSCAQWKLYHEALVNHYGKRKGTEVWLNAWYNPKYDTWVLENTDFCGYNHQFVTHFRKYGIDLSNTFYRNMENMKKFFDKIESGVGNTIQVAGFVAIGAAIYFAVKAYQDINK